MAFDALETEFANAKLVRSLSRRDDRRYYWRLLSPDADGCTRVMTRFANSATTSEKPATQRTIELLGEPCAVLQLEKYLTRLHRFDALQALQFVRNVLATVVRPPWNERLSATELLTLLGKTVPSPKENDLKPRSRSRRRKDDVSVEVRPSVSVSSPQTAPVPPTQLSHESPMYIDLCSRVKSGDDVSVFSELASQTVVWLQFEIIPGFISCDEFVRFSQLKEFAMRPVTPDDFTTFRVMGRGAYGAVYAVEKVNTHRVYAWKEMNKRQLKHQRAIDVALNEARILSEIDSPFVTGLRYCLQTSESLVLVLDFCSGGDLSYHMKKKPPINNFVVKTDALQRSSVSSRRRRKNPLPPELAQFYVAEIILGLEHMHSKRIVFRDLKPANILLDRHGHVLLSDLGLAKKFNDRKPTTSSLGGTPGYWAPEVLARQPYAVWVDWWSLGVFLYEALCGMRPACRCARGTPEWCPFVDSKEQEDNAKKGGTLKLCVDFPDPFFTSEARDLIEKLLLPHPADRLGYNGSEEIKSHPYFQNIDWALIRRRSVAPLFVPGDNVHAVSVQEVGEINKQRYKKVSLDHRDHKLFSQFKYMDDRIVQDEIVQVLQEESGKDGSQWTPFEMNGRSKANTNPRCCTIL